MICCCYNVSDFSFFNGQMEQRQHPRVQIPLLVEIRHPSIGQIRAMARDVSKGGIFVHLQQPNVNLGAKLKITLLNPSGVDNQPTPTVDMEVKRVEADGIGLTFTNTAGSYLWASVQRLREELAIGRDYFQVHQSIVAVNGKEQILTVQQNGKWLFPGTYLIVGEDWQAAAQAFLHQQFGFESPKFEATLAIDSTANAVLPEAAVVRMIHLYRVSENQCRLPDAPTYKDLRWISRQRDVEDATFASDLYRDAAKLTIRRLLDEAVSKAS